MREQESLAPGSLVSKRTFAEIQKQAIISNTFCLKKILLLILFEAGWDCEQNFFYTIQRWIMLDLQKRTACQSSPLLGPNLLKASIIGKS